jgi:hypothetical protein
VTYNAETLCFHPHIHIIAEGKYMMDGFLSQAWKKVTGDSYITHIRFVRTTAEAVNYVTKYVTSGVGFDVIDNPAALKECVQTLGGFHSIIRFGTWARGTLKFKPDPEAWRLVGWYESIMKESEDEWPYMEVDARLYVNRCHDPPPKDW